MSFEQPKPTEEPSLFRLESKEDIEVLIEVVLQIEREIASKSMEGKEYIVRDQVYTAAERFLDKHRSICFEGFGGWNRYRINRDGAIMLSDAHSTGPCRQKAIELGIEVGII
jgi:hypothetical protein